jgi:hypothetical protein
MKHKTLRLLKFDSAHPLAYLDKKQREAAAVLQGYSFAEYYDWLMKLRVGLSDYITHQLVEAGWEAQECVPWDLMLLQKAADARGKAGFPGFPEAKPLLRHVAGLTLREVVGGHWQRGWNQARSRWLIEQYIEAFRPNVILVREPCHLDGQFWDRYRNRCVIASFIACNTNHATNWDPHRSDLIFTLTPEYRNFFSVQGIETHILEYGVDERIAHEVAGLPKVHDCTFVGYLGQSTQSRKTELMNAVAGAVDFKWWGVKGPELSRFPALERTWQGETAGIDMLRIYKQSRVVLNDYVDMAGNTNVNMRTKEVMSVGTLLLTRQAANVTGLEREGALATFADADDCVVKIKHYLKNDEARERIAARGLQVALRDFNYKDITRQMMDVIAELYTRKSGAKKERQETDASSGAQPTDAQV